MKKCLYLYYIICYIKKNIYIYKIFILNRKSPVCVVLYHTVFMLLYHLLSLFFSVWSVKVQRSNRPLPWESGTNNNSNFLPYQHYNTYHPDQSRSQAKQKSSPNNPRNAPFLSPKAFISPFLIILTISPLLSEL